jgi:hypothetical protein
LRRLYIGLAHHTHTGIEFWFDMPIEEAEAWSRVLEEMLAKDNKQKSPDIGPGH